ncbi:MAG: ArsR family transcriptional regulator [Chitinispirillaceae bacterium]|nr:ArsR family transcriptional regulator [Chitinispirillaceae bacterium]
MKEKKNNFQVKIFEQFSLIGKALSSSSRLHIIDLLHHAERTVEGLAQEASLTVANTSQHLQILRQTGIVLSRRKGNFILYRLASTDVSHLWQTVQTVGRKHLKEIEKTVSAHFTRKHELEKLDYVEIIRRTNAGEIVLLDVRPEEEFQHAHIENATSIPLKVLKKRFAELPQNKIIVAYCCGPYCVISEEAVKFLRKKGLEAYRMPDPF